MNKMGQAIICKGLKKQLGNFTLDYPVFTVAEGTVHGLIGANGSGKTTTLKLLLGLLRQDAGDVSVLGSTNIGVDDQARNSIGFMVDGAGIPSMLNPIELGRLFQSLYTYWDASYYQQLLMQFHLDAKKPYRKCSRGMKVKIQLALALSHNAKLLILDEPTSGLDPVSRDEIITLLSRYSEDENHTILISSHITSDLEKLCDYVTFLEDGKIRLSSEKDELLERYRLIQIPSTRIADVEPNTIKGRRDGQFQSEFLMRTEEVPPFGEAQRVTLEQIIIMLSVGGDWS
ncbi:ABC transporter ATP-binding protein [Sphaerochaeta halotolerans]|jgi:ABC-2 type transport system ATP-binding protein|uniref:ABC transporter ATP-binding protein n=1 Tax=Sphaerochaeta halotolerans TaxID=2293840 RepID=A0A372MFW3_9SPIR|nr:ABC transporter ATP-binding protein [Sphaerochaeta halotolerans]RFU94634.1 ABC transporter ATP-binding protein [Sphaerochaeta halotolerans]